MNAEYPSARSIRKFASEITSLMEGRKYKVSRNDLLFGLSLIDNLVGGNASISPVSIRTSLAMLYEGAIKETAKQIAAGAFISRDVEKRREEFSSVVTALTKTGPYTLKFANGLWLDRAFPMEQSFQDVLIGSYGAEADSANFGENAERERSRINQWINRKTDGEIMELFPASSFNELTSLVLASASYFKAFWVNKFNPIYTKRRDFNLQSGETEQVDMMRKGEIESGEDLPKFQYHEGDNAQTLVLPYRGGRLANILLLPKPGISLRDLESRLKTDPLEKFGLTGETYEAELSRLEIPRHEFRGEYDLSVLLKKVGIRRIFEETAELNKISSKDVVVLGGLYVSSARHQTYFKTDEEGSEGAAAVGLGVVALGASPRVEFVVDRPFLEMVVEYSTGSILFLNRILNPNQMSGSLEGLY